MSYLTKIILYLICVLHHFFLQTDFIEGLWTLTHKKYSIIKTRITNQLVDRSQFTRCNLFSFHMFLSFLMKLSLSYVSSDIKKHIQHFFIVQDGCKLNKVYEPHLQNWTAGFYSILISHFVVINVKVHLKPNASIYDHIVS